MLVLDVPPVELLPVVVPPDDELPVTVTELVLIMTVLALLVAFALFALSVVVQPAQKAATASKTKRAKVLRIEFFSCNPKGSLLESCIGLHLILTFGEASKVSSVKVRAT